jgi:hypothetical protein
MNNENIFFSIDVDNNEDNLENNIENNLENNKDDEIDNLSDLLNEINNDDFVNQMNNLLDEEMFESMYYEYKNNYTVKELLLICDYYGIAKEMKNNKYNKEEIINVLVQFENNPINNDIFMRRQSMWYYIDKLKNDKFMKKYVLW